MRVGCGIVLLVCAPCASCPPSNSQQFLVLRWPHSDQFQRSARRELGAGHGGRRDAAGARVRAGSLRVEGRAARAGRAAEAAHAAAIAKFESLGDFNAVCQWRGAAKNLVADDIERPVLSAGEGNEGNEAVWVEKLSDPGKKKLEVVVERKYVRSKFCFYFICSIVQKNVFPIC